MKKILALIAMMSFATLAQAGIIVNVSAPTPVADPFNGALLDSYIVSITATGGGEVVTAVDVSFDSPSGKQLHQEMTFKPGFLPPHYNTTAMNDMAAAGFPADYIAADTHFLMPTTLVVWSAAVATEDLDETILPRDSFDVWHSYGVSLKSNPMGLSNALQTSLVQLAQIVIPRNSQPGVVELTGTVATNQVGNPVAFNKVYIPPIPEPATLVLLGIGSLLGLRRRK